MFSLLKIVVSGYKMLENDFTIDFFAKAKVSENDLSSEIQEIDDKLFDFTSLVFTGSNSSGKTTVLSLIDNCLHFIKYGRWRYRRQDFSNDFIKVNLEFYLNGKIFKYCGNIMRESDESENPMFCRIVDLYFYSAKYVGKIGRRYANLKFNNLTISQAIGDTSILTNYCKEYVKYDKIYPKAHISLPMGRSPLAVLSNLNPQTQMSIIRLLDDSIEYLEVKKSNELIELKRFGEKKQFLNIYEIMSILSNGTIRGIDLFCRAILALKHGSILIVDEIENCFHKNLVNNILFLFNDKSLNTKNSHLIFSTHYVEILDVLNRRDNINVLHKKNGKITLANIYEDYGPRSELLKSKLFDNNTFRTLLNYDQLMLVKRNIKYEIFDND